MKRLLVMLMATMAIGALALVIDTTAGAQPAHSARAAKIQLRQVGKLGKALTNGHGQTLYLFEKDKHGKSACSGQCAKFWPPAFTTGKPSAGPGVSSSKLGTTKRKDGKLQVTYNGHPLYAYSGDTRAGQASGEGLNFFGAKWYVVNAKGNKIDNDD